MKLDELLEDSKNLIKERIGYIFISFQKAFPEVGYDERPSIVGIGEPGKHLLCYFRRDDKEIYVKFKSSNEAFALTSMNIAEIDSCINKTVELFQNNKLVSQGKRSVNNGAYIRQKNQVFEMSKIRELLEDVVLTHGSVVIRNVASRRLTNALFNRGIIRISDLSGWNTAKLLKVRNFGITCLEELYYVCHALKKDEEASKRDKEILFNKATKALVKRFSENVNIQNYLISINFDETLFEEETLGRILCLRNKVLDDQKIFFSKNQISLQEQYLLNYKNFEQMYSEYQTLLKNVINEHIIDARDRNIILKLLGFDGNNYTLAAVGEIYNITRERVRQIFSKKVRRLAYRFNLNTGQGISNYNARNNFLSNFSSCPIDCFMLYLKAEKNEYSLRAFEMVVLHKRSVPNNLENLLSAGCKFLKNRETFKFLTQGEFISKYNEFYVITNENGVVLTDIALLEKLKKARAIMARKLGLPDLLVYRNRQLVLLATYKPLDKETWELLPKFSKKTWDEYDVNMLEVIKQHVGEKEDFIEEPEPVEQDLEKAHYFSNEKLNSLALELRAFAEEQAKEDGILYWKILRRTAIKDLCKKLPVTKEELIAKKVILGRFVREVYGERIVEIIKNFVADEMPFLLDDKTAVKEEVKNKKKAEKNNLEITVDGFRVYVDEDGAIITDMALLKRLIALRDTIANEKNVQHYDVGGSSFLVELATFKPQTKEQCLELKYIRDNWFDKYGIIFLKEINEHFNSK